MKLTFLFIKNYENLPRPLGGGGGGGWSSVLFLQFNLLINFLLTTLHL
jgi:hypothetical protein